jgi:hypothetical protein
MRQRGDLSHRGSAAWPTLRPCPGLRSLGVEFSGAPVQGGLRTTAMTAAKSVLPFLSHLKPPGASRRLPFDAGKNSAPRARRPQPRCNAGQSAGAGSKGPVVGEGRVRLRPTRPKRLKQLAAVKRQPPGHPCKSSNRLKVLRRWGCNPVFISTRLPAGARRPGPPPRNCLRRLAPVGPDSTLPAPKR